MQDWIKEQPEEDEYYEESGYRRSTQGYRKPPKRRKWPYLFAVLASLALLLAVVSLRGSDGDGVNIPQLYFWLHRAELQVYPERMQTLMQENKQLCKTALRFARNEGGDYGISPEDYPEELITLLESNPETAEFVVEYPVEKDAEHEIDLEFDGSVPLYMQWDQRWGYEEYGGNFIALNGCGPTCLSMAAVYLTGNTEYDPLWMCRWSEEQGYYVPGAGTAWSLFSDGAEALGMTAEEISPYAEQIEAVIADGGLVACIMGPGDFTTEGHFILLTGYQDGAVTVHDPNSIARSEQSWVFEEIRDQILCLWGLY